MKEKLECSSCGIDITNDEGNVKFKCPKCEKEEIIRCGHCREIAARYTCKKCGFSGPN